MANNIAKSPLYIDTADAGMVLTTSLTVEAIRWVGATTAGHTAVIQDADGRVIWACSATGAGFSHESNVPIKMTGGFKVPTLGSGFLLLYRENPR